MLTQEIKNKLNKLIGASQKPKVILGLSGGPDSIFLFHILKELADENVIELIAAHLNHDWREEAKQDEVFCKNLCKQYNVPLIAKHADDLKINLKFNGSKEEIGRKLRRYFFEEVLKEHNAQFIALAHHLQDQQETFFWRIIRGCTLSGLTCMREKDGVYIRPLLNINKENLLKYLKENNLDFVEDESNTSDAFLRNRIRKYVLPSFKKCDERFDKKFQDTLFHLQKEESFLKTLIEKTFESVFEKKKNLVGDLKKFLALDSVLQHRVIVYWFCKEKVNFNLSHSFILEITRFLSSPRGGVHELNQNWNIKKKNQFFWIEKSA